MIEDDDDMQEGFWKAVTKYGLGTVGFVVLFWFMLTDARADMKANRAEHLDFMSGLSAIKDISGQSDMAMQQVLYVLQTMCVNQARTTEQRDNCQRRIDTRTR